MLDIGFSEILVIFVLALIVLGPERLPGVVRKVGRWVGRARAMARQFQDQLEEEIDLDGSRARPVPPPLPPDPPVYTEPASALQPQQATSEGAAPGGEPALSAQEKAATAHTATDPHEPGA